MRTLILVLVLALTLGGCVIAGPTEKSLVHSYRLSADESVKRVQADPVTPQWVKDSAQSDHDALVAIDAIMQGKAVTP